MDPKQRRPINRPATFKQAKMVLGCRDDALRRALHEEVVRGVKLGKSWKISWDSLSEIVGRPVGPEDFDDGSIG